MAETATTRDEILELLKRRPGATVEELSRSLRISAMGVRQHLAILERDGLIHSTKRRGGMGRPANLYFLTERGQETFPRAYDRLALQLLAAAERLGGPELVERFFDEREEILAEELSEKLQGSEGEERIRRLMEIQKASGYQAEVQLHDGRIHLLQYNCPIARVAARYADACRKEHELYERLLGTELEQSGCAARGEGPCVYAANLADLDAPALEAARG
ncbi:MAG: HTH domain-containing protein [Bacillota bacterium]|nr:HTH domain-containing protein [Bacillota bacterium]